MLKHVFITKSSHSQSKRSCSGCATMNRCGLCLHVHLTEFDVQNKKLELQFTSNEGALENP